VELSGYHVAGSQPLHLIYALSPSGGRHLSLTGALTRAVEEYRRATFLESLRNDYAALKTDATAWKDEQAESCAWDATSADGLIEE